MSVSVSESQDIEREKCGNELKEVGGSRDMDSSGLVKCDKITKLTSTGFGLWVACILGGRDFD